MLMVSVPVPDADFLDGWKISGNDPVWQTLDMKQAPTEASLPIKPDHSSIFGF